MDRETANADRQETTPMPYACFCESDDGNPAYMCDPCKARAGGSRFVLEPSDIAITHDSQRLGLFELLGEMRDCSPQIEAFRSRLQALLVPAIHPPALRRRRILSIQRAPLTGEGELAAGLVR